MGMDFPTHLHPAQQQLNSVFKTAGQSPRGPSRHSCCLLTVPRRGFPTDRGPFFPEPPSDPRSPRPLPTFHVGPPGIGELGPQTPGPCEASLHPAAFDVSGECLLPTRATQPQTPQKETLARRPPICPFRPGHPESTPTHQEPPGSHLLSPGPVNRGLPKRATPEHLLRPTPP